MKKFLILILLISGISKSQIYTPKDVEICNSKFAFAEKNHLGEKQIGDIITAIGKSFLGTEYVAHTLEKGNKEQLVVDLSGLDCTTFLENTLALAICIKENKLTFEDFKQN